MSDRIELRALASGDASFVQSLYADGRVTRTLLRIQASISIAEAREYCEALPGTTGDHRFAGALRSDGTCVALGSVRRHPARAGVVSIGYSVVPAFWGHGVATELAALLVQFAARSLGAREVRATTLNDSPASARVLEQLGFTAVEVGSVEVDSRGDERRVTRWSLRGPRPP